MKDFLLTATYLVGLGELLLAGYFWKTNSGSEIRKVMALLAFSTGMWVVSSAFVAYRSSSILLHDVDRFIYVFGILLITSLVHFALVFPYPLFRIDIYHRILLYVPAIVFSLISLTSNQLSLGVSGDGMSVGSAQAGPLLNHYNIYLLLLYSLTIWIMVKRLPKLTGTHYTLTKLMAITIFIGGMPAVVIDLLLPTFAPSIVLNYLFGNLFTSVWLGATSFVVMRRA